MAAKKQPETATGVGETDISNDQPDQNSEMTEQLKAALEQIFHNTSTEVEVEVTDTVSSIPQELLRLGNEGGHNLRKPSAFRWRLRHQKDASQPASRLAEKTDDVFKHTDTTPWLQLDLNGKRSFWERKTSPSELVESHTLSSPTTPLCSDNSWIKHEKPRPANAGLCTTFINEVDKPLASRIEKLKSLNFHMTNSEEKDQTAQTQKAHPELRKRNKDGAIEPTLSDKIEAAELVRDRLDAKLKSTLASHVRLQNQLDDLLGMHTSGRLGHMPEFDADSATTSREVPRDDTIQLLDTKNPRLMEIWAFDHISVDWATSQTLNRAYTLAHQLRDQINEVTISALYHRAQPGSVEAEQIDHIVSYLENKRYIVGVAGENIQKRLEWYVTDDDDDPAGIEEEAIYHDDVDGLPSLTSRIVTLPDTESPRSQPVSRPVSRRRARSASYDRFPEADNTRFDANEALAEQLPVPSLDTLLSNRRNSHRSKGRKDLGACAILLLLIILFVVLVNLYYARLWVFTSSLPLILQV
ncbi:hypothetical protein LTS08_003428 [Lithohypha guttulata]|nr:hypothetical protein LTS08_003428 [Lithohypha guttulata]